MKEYRFSAVLEQNGDMDAAYVVFPFDIRTEFGKGRIRVHAEFDGAPYDGSIVNMGVRDACGDIRYIIGVTKAIRKAIGKTFGDMIDVVITESQ